MIKEKAGNCLNKKPVQLQQDWFGSSTWPPFRVFWTPVTSCENTRYMYGLVEDGRVWSYQAMMNNC